MVEMSGIKNLANIGLADIIGISIGAVFWFYLAILISPDSLVNYIFSLVL